MLSVPVIILIVAAVIAVVGIVFGIIAAVRSHKQSSADADAAARAHARWGDSLGFTPDSAGVAAAVSQWEHGPATDGGLHELRHSAMGEYEGHPALIFAEDDGWIVAVQRDTASSVVVEIHPVEEDEQDNSGKATDLQVYASDVDAMIRATDDRLVEVLDNHPDDLAMAWSEGYWSAALMPLEDDGFDTELNPDDKINEELPTVLHWLSRLNDALRVLPPREGEEESLSLQGVGPTRPLADRTDDDSLPVDADAIEPEEAGFLPSDSSFMDDDQDVPFTVVGDQPVAPIWEGDFAEGDDEDDVDDGIDGTDDLLIPDNVIPFAPAGSTNASPSANNPAGLTVVPEPDNAAQSADEPAADHVDESAFVENSWEPQEPVPCADLSDDDDRSADDDFVTEADFAEADRLMGEYTEIDETDSFARTDDIFTDDNATEQAEHTEQSNSDEQQADSEDIEAAEDALAAYAEAEAVEAVDEFPGETRVENVPADDEWITPTTAEFDVIPGTDEEAATLAVIDSKEPQDSESDIATEDFSADDLAEDGLSEDDLIATDDDEQAEQSGADDEAPDMGANYHEISEPLHFEGQDTELDIDALGAPEHTGPFDVITDADLAAAASDDLSDDEAHAVDVLRPYEDDEEEYIADEDSYDDPDDVAYTDKDFGEDTTQADLYDTFDDADSSEETTDEGINENETNEGETDEIPDELDDPDEAINEIDEPERPTGFTSDPPTAGFPSREVEFEVGDGDNAAAATLGERSAVPPVAATSSDTRPRIAFVKPFSPEETGPLPVVTPVETYYPQADDTNDEKQQTSDITVPQPQESVSTGSHAVREGEPSTMQTGQFPIIRPSETTGSGRHVRKDDSADAEARPAWFVPGKTGSRSRAKDNETTGEIPDDEN
mgnify:CR=1 FL=1